MNAGPARAATIALELALHLQPSDRYDRSHIWKKSQSEDPMGRFADMAGSTWPLPRIQVASDDGASRPGEAVAPRNAPPATGVPGIPAEDRIVRPATPADHPAIIALMAKVSHLPADHPNLRPDHFHWKFTLPRGDHHEPRNWVVEQDGRIVGHFGLWPVWIRTLAGEVDCMHGLDWVASPDARGSGALAVEPAHRQRSARCIAGGSRDALRARPRMGFRYVQDLVHFARPVRPFRQARNRVERFPLLRLPFTLWWRYWPPARHRGWEASAITPEALPESLYPTPSEGMGVFRRSADLFRYLLACPIAPVTLYRARGPDAEGYFCIARAPGVARIIDAWTPSASADHWAALYECAWRTAAADPEVCEVVTLVGITRAQEGLRRAGFRARESIEFCVSGRIAPLADCSEFHFQWIDNDKSVWHRGIYSYYT